MGPPIEMTDLLTSLMLVVLNFESLCNSFAIFFVPIMLCNLRSLFLLL
jgi:hypothetical protein